MRFALVGLALLIYVVSIAPTAYMLLRPLEGAYPVPSKEAISECDAYVVLGGGINESAPTLDGKGMPEPEALFRALGAYRLYLLSPKPIIVSGGIIWGRESEAGVTGRLLVTMGVKEHDIIPEAKAWDTYENARYTREICEKKGFRRVLLITSAFHMRRSVMLFEKHSVSVVPYPVGFKVHEENGPLGLVPDATNLYHIAIALKEYLGILFYRITL